MTTVYSRFDAELFWNRIADPVLRYEVRRDGAVVATGDFTSYYAPNLSAGRKPNGGRLSIASGQDTWKIDAFNGDAGSFTFTTSVKGATTSVTVPGSDGYRFKGIDPSKVQLGF